MLRLSPRRVFRWGGRVPVWLGNTIAGAGARVVVLRPPAAVLRWRANVAAVVGLEPDRRATRLLVRHWLMNRLWSLSLAKWPNLRRISIDPADEQRMRDSLAGPGLVLALPHMGSWDGAGAWCTRAGMPVVSVAERLPGGLFEEFRAAREAMGMKIYPVAERGLTDSLAADVADGLVLCLLADRDLSAHGVAVRWPTGFVSKVPAGPALLARRTGADLRVATARFVGGRLRLSVSERIVVDEVVPTMQRVVERFAAAISADPANWLVLQPMTR